MKIDPAIQPADFLPRLPAFWERSAHGLDRLLEREKDEGDQGAPVFTARGRYTARGWTDWTRGFLYGSALLQYDAGGADVFLLMGRERTLAHMTPHLTHMGVHDHGFNQVSTYGNLWRLMNEGRIEENAWERRTYQIALQCSGAVQARRWTRLPGDEGYIYSFNGPHSLFADTIRSLRSLALAHRLGHVLLEENDTAVSLLDRLIRHATTTARYIVFYGDDRDRYDERGRVAHEAIFNTHDGRFRCPSSQQGYSPFSTWTRGLAWIMCGYAEQLEFIDTVPDAELEPHGGREPVTACLQEAAHAACDYYLQHTPLDGVPYWDTGAPGLAHLDDYLHRPADPFNDHEPVDSSAAAIAAQGLLRFGHYLNRHGDAGTPYCRAGLTILRTLLAAPYLNQDDAHEGLLLHAIYHHPRGWDYQPPDRSVPCGESCMWGDYHLREAVLYVQRLLEDGPYYSFFSDPRHEGTPC